MIEDTVIRQVPRRSGCMGCILAWPDGRLAHLRNGKTCSSIIGGEAGRGRHPFTMEGADCRHHIWVPVDEEAVTVPRKMFNKIDLVRLGLQERVPQRVLGILDDCRESKMKEPAGRVTTRVGGTKEDMRNETPIENQKDYFFVWDKNLRKHRKVSEKEFYEHKLGEPPPTTMYATGGPGPADNPWRPTLSRDTKQEEADSLAQRIVRMEILHKQIRRKVRGSQQDPAQTVVVVIGRQKFLDDI